MPAHSLKYEPSGKIGNSILTLAFIALPATLILAVIYGYVAVYNPLVGKLSFLISLAYGGAVSYCVYKCLEWGKCRSRGFAALSGLAFGLFALYAAWVMFEYALMRRASAAAMPGSALNLFWSPRTVWEISRELNATGWFSIGRRGGTISGILLSVFWIIEALIILAMTFFVPLLVLNKVFCEHCNHWCRGKENLARFEPTDNARLQERIKNGDLTAFAELTLSPITSKAYFRIDAQTCPTCSDTATFEVKYVTEEKVTHGEQSSSSEDICPPVMLTPEALRQFQAALAQAKTASNAPVSTPGA